MSLPSLALDALRVLTLGALTVVQKSATGLIELLEVEQKDQILEGLKQDSGIGLNPELAASGPKATKDVVPTNLEVVASYNWTNSITPTIIVPGLPRVWKGIKTPFFLSSNDKERIEYIDQNRFRLPNFPLLPLVAAIDQIKPQFDFSSIDIVTDRNNLQKLMKWIGKRVNPELDDFRIDIQVIGKTVLFVRYELRNTERGRRGKTFRKNFDEYLSQYPPGFECSTSNHRIIRYDYGGIQMLVRFKVDAFCPSDGETFGAKGNEDESLVDNATLVAALRTISCDDLNIISGGTLVPQSQIIKLHTRHQWPASLGLDWDKYYPQIFLSQTHRLLLGTHTQGRIRRIREYTSGDDIVHKQKGKQQHELDKLCVLLKAIRKEAISFGDRACLSLVYRRETKMLELFERYSSNALPDEWMAKFENPKGSSLFKEETE
ncbi:geranylgeranyl pyrophosphate synthetase [Pyrrhoderma noxium]|uniref:Geranylgeranyl pyrophosphate synthetase n=1 Tax=Pyrrhoderma noxium TaxID=2282107 RepID=A0A286UBC4_9AGAM|nr:geranylgeranyl pyrophosphate synthetase [Pyrrhoderma noxium]